MENPIKMDDLGDPYFWFNTHMVFKKKHKLNGGRVSNKCQTLEKHVENWNLPTRSIGGRPAEQKHMESVSSELFFMNLWIFN